MKLKEWRHTHNLTLAECADLFGVKHARTYHRYETGEILADAPFVAAVSLISEGAVTGDDIYAQRAEYLSQRGILVLASITEGAAA